MNRIKVRVNWEGGKATCLPNGLQYVTVAKFDDNWIKNTWSVILEFTTPPSKQGNPSLGYAKFLVADAPHDKLSSGKMFELYEGRELTAKVFVI